VEVLANALLVFPTANRSCQTSEVPMIPSPDDSHPIRGVDTPPSEPAAQPSTPPHYAGHTPSEPGYGPNPTAQGVRGYRDLPADDVALINAVKELQENVANVWAAIYLREGTDQRWANIAKLHLEEGISALVRSVAKPHDPFRAALQRLQHDAEQRARDAVARDLKREPAHPSGQSTVEPDPAQPSHDHRPDEGSPA
jgi:hypothetical protein